MCTSSNFRSREPLPSLKNLVLQKDIVCFVMTKKQNISKRATQPIAALYIARNAGLTSKWVFLLLYWAPRPSNEVYCEVKWLSLCCEYYWINPGKLLNVTRFRWNVTHAVTKRIGHLTRVMICMMLCEHAAPHLNGSLWEMKIGVYSMNYRITTCNILFQLIKMY